MILDDRDGRKSCTVSNSGQSPVSGTVRRPPDKPSASERRLPHSHAVVWIDHHEARVIYFNADDADEKTVHPAHPSHHLHHKAGSASGTHDKGEPSFYRDVAEALGEANEFLVVGPSTAKTEFVTWLHGHSPALAGRLFGVEPLQHMSDGQIVAEARRFFKGADRIRPPAP
jgi:hypothetical protein